MKTRNTILVALMGLLFGAGCASENSSVADPSIPGCVDVSCAYPGTPEPPRSSSSGGYYTGSTATLQANLSALARMFFNSNPNSPTDIRINIDLNRSVDSVVVSFVDGGRVIEGAFGTVHPCAVNPQLAQQMMYMFGVPCSGHSNNSHNGWVNQGGQLIWKGFFQDEYGAIVLVIDNNVTQGDGQPANILGGSIWFQNFNRYYPNNPIQGPKKMCWEISLGPYDCRTFLSGGKVSMTSSYYPTNRGPDANVNYEKLGDFTGIIRNEAGF